MVSCTDKLWCEVLVNHFFEVQTNQKETTSSVLPAADRMQGTMEQQGIMVKQDQQRIHVSMPETTQLPEAKHPTRAEWLFDHVFSWHSMMMVMVAMMMVMMVMVMMVEVKVVAHIWVAQCGHLLHLGIAGRVKVQFGHG